MEKSTDNKEIKMLEQNKKKLEQDKKPIKYIEREYRENFITPPKDEIWNDKAKREFDEFMSDSYDLYDNS